MSSPVQDVLDRLFSLDANDRVKAANEIGELGTPNEAPTVLKVVYEDEASTVRQMAIQSYYEIMKQDAFDELKKVVNTHSDDYVKIYALSVLEKFPSTQTEELFTSGLQSDNPRIRATVTRAILHANSMMFGEKLLDLLNTEKDNLVLRNILESFALWKYKPSKNKLMNLLESDSNIPEDPELLTMLLFALAALGEKSALKRLQEEDVDEFIRIKYKNEMFRGKQGLLELLKQI